MKIYCLSIYNQHFDKFKSLNLIPVGLGVGYFDKRWLNDKSKDNISHKNINYGEYTFHYNLWKNEIINEKKNWIGFCTYRRFWVKNKIDRSNDFKTLENNILKEPRDEWDKTDVILGEPLVHYKLKNMKLIKRNFLEVLKKPSVLYRRNSIKDHFNIFHGSFFLKEAINLLTHQNKEGFEMYLNDYLLHPFNMFICKNSEILNEFYNEIFPWLFKCEEIFKNYELKGYDKIRIYGFLAERYMPYWFIKNFKTTTNPITFLEN